MLSKAIRIVILFLFVTGFLCGFSLTGAQAQGQTIIYDQPPSATGMVYLSSWWTPNDSDHDQYVYDDFVLPTAQSISEIQWRGAFDPAKLGFGGPVLDFTVAIYASIPAGTQPDVVNPPLVKYQTGGNAGQTPAGTIGITTFYDYQFALPTPFQAVAGTKYWVQIEAWQNGVPDWCIAQGTGGGAKHFRKYSNGQSWIYQGVSGDASFKLLSSGQETLVSPSGSIDTNKPTYVWNAVSTAEDYQLAVYDSSGAWPIITWYTAADVGCSSGTGPCSITPNVALPPGNSTWYILTKNSVGTGSWSDPMAFSVSLNMKATLISPSGSITTNQPTYTWNAISYADWYLLAVKDSTGAWPINTWYTAAQAGCSSGTGTCSLPGIALATGDSEWYIQTWSSAYSVGAWSDPKAFKVISLTPGQATLISPSASISTNQPTYVWNAVSSAEQYLLAVKDSTGAWPINTWYTAVEAGCSSGTGTCSFTPNVALPPGNSTWYIQTKNSYGTGPWSDPQAFTVSMKATLTSPSGSISTNQPTYTWNAVNYADWYLLAVKDSTGAWPINTWYTAAQADCSGGTGTCSLVPGIALAAGDGEWYIQTWSSTYSVGAWSDPKAFSVP